MHQGHIKSFRGLGAVTVIDLHGFLGRTSSYWTEATIRTHKITKPLIWKGMFLAILGGIITDTPEKLRSTYFILPLLRNMYSAFEISIQTEYISSSNQ